MRAIKYIQNLIQTSWRKKKC